jgi:hypothetical protein
MGGNNLPGIKTSRKNLDDYTYIKHIVLDILKLQNIHASCPREIPNKTNFGDLDVIVSNDDTINFIDFIKEHFKPTVYTPSYRDKKLNVISFNSTIDALKEHNTFQIDFIFCNEHQIDMFIFYYSYGDLGGILGRICSAHALKFGQDGLFMMFNVETMSLNAAEMQDYCLLSENPKEICEYLNLDYEYWNKSYKSLEDIFNWICQSSFFDKDIFTVLNHGHRDRVKKRPMYLQFLTFININLDDITNATTMTSEIIVNKQQHAIDYFKKQHIVDAIRKDKQKQRLIKSKYNAHNFIKLGITGKNIPMAKAKFEQYILNKHNSLDDFVLSCDDIDTILAYFIKNEKVNYLISP